jgi:hypothetical protein
VVLGGGVNGAVQVLVLDEALWFSEGLLGEETFDEFGGGVLVVLVGFGELLLLCEGVGFSGETAAPYFGEFIAQFLGKFECDAAFNASH